MLSARGVSPNFTTYSTMLRNAVATMRGLRRLRLNTHKREARSWRWRVGKRRAMKTRPAMGHQAAAIGSVIVGLITILLLLLVRLF